MTLLYFLLVPFAVEAIIQAWFHDTDSGTGLFEDIRDGLARWQPEGLVWWYLAALLICPFCLTYHVAFWVTGYTVLLQFLPEPWNTVGGFPLYALSVALALNMLRIKT